MLDFLKTNWIKILLVLGLLFLCWVIVRPKAPDNTHVDEKHAVDSTANYWQKQIQIAESLKDSLLQKSIVKDSIIASLAAKVYVKEVQLSKTVQEMKDLAANYKASKDTVYKLKACDSLSDLVQAQDFQIQGFADLTDSIVVQHNRAMAEQIQAYAILNTQFANQGIALKDVSTKYDGLYKDYNKSVKANKFNKTLSRVLAVVVIALGSAILIK